MNRAGNHAAKRIVIITGSGREHHYVANALTADFEVAAILVCDPPARRSWKSVLKRHPDKFAGKMMRQLFLRMIGDQNRRQASLARVLGAASGQFDRPDLVRQVGRPKAGKLHQAVVDLRPDILAIYGTGVIPGEVLAAASEIALNMHTGISPDYRGVQCALWPIIDQRPDMVGATVHECTQAVDGGKIYFTGKARLHADDDLHAIFARAVEIGTQGYRKVIAAVVAGAAAGREQDQTIGKEYKGLDLDLWTELKARLALRSLRRRGRLTS